MVNATVTQPTPPVSQVVSPTPPVSQVVSNPTPTGQQTLQSVANNNIFGTGIDAGGKAGQLYDPITQGQQASLFQAPQTVAGVNNSIGQNIQGGFDRSNQASPVAGLTTLGGVTNANAANINTATSNALTAAQLQQVNELNAQANGQGPSVAAVQAQQTGQQNVANEMAMIGSQRGGSANSALGLRSAQNAIAGANQQAVQAATLGRTQEELNAQQQLTGALGTAQGQTMQGAQAQAALTQQANLANAGAANTSTLQQGSMNQQTALTNAGMQLQQSELNDNQYNAMLGAQSNEENAQMTGNMNYANLVQGAQTAANAVAAGQDISEANNQMQLYGAGIGAFGSLGAGVAQAFSDRNLKTNITSANRSMKEFLSKIPSKPMSSFFHLLSEAL